MTEAQPLAGLFVAEAQQSGACDIVLPLVVEAFDEGQKLGWLGA